MLRTFLTALFLTFPFHVHSGETLDYDAGVALREAAFAGDIETVETMLETAQAAYEAGEIPADQVRILNTPFGYTHPKMVAFIEKWRAERPTSPYAKIAKVWSLHRKSYAIRGEGYARQLYPEALHRFSQMQRQSWDLAEEVYQEHPRMIHASDALLRLANGSGNQRKAMKALHATMKEDPNRGTLQRGLDMMLPGWGWKWKDVRRLCDRYAARIEKPDPKPDLTCKVRKARWFDANSLNWMHREIIESDLVDLDHLRIGRTIYSVKTREDAAKIRKHLMDGHGDEAYWNFFDQAYAQKFGLELVYGQLSQMKHDSARRRLEHDPYNIGLLETVLIPVEETRVSDKGKVELHVVQEPTSEERLEYARRLIVASPYSPKFWRRFAMETRRADPTAPVTVSWPYRINAVVYDNHSPVSLYGFMQDQMRYRNALLKIERNEASEEVAESHSAMDMEQHVLCPFIRAARLYERICSSQNLPGCEHSDVVNADYLALNGQAKRKEVCQEERRAPVKTLLFSAAP